jgi:hypothetical protein
VKEDIDQIDMEAFSNVIYYFCKFQQGQPEFWSLLEKKLLVRKESMTVQQLSRCLLALIMNPRPIGLQLGDGVLSEILNKLQLADA